MSLNSSASPRLCDESDIYADDEEAAVALRDLLVASGAARAPVSWFFRRTHEPADAHAAGASCAIKIPESQAKILARRNRLV